MKLRFFQLARKLSYQSTYKYKLGAVLVKGSKILGLGFNKVKTHPLSRSEYQHLHAEVSAIINSNSLQDLLGASIYVYRETKDGNPSNAKPCPGCESFLREVGVKRVFYTNEGKYQEMKLCS